jgi:hypothetical protein
MPRSASAFRQTDVTRMLRAVAAAGVEVVSVQVDKEGRIVVNAGKPMPSPKEGTGDNEWDGI